jgi:hypothetical protein
MAPLVRWTQAHWDDVRSRYARMHSQRSRTAGSNLYPHLNSNPMGTAASQRPQGGSASARLYPHLPQQSTARMQQPKPRVRMTHARRLYGNLE